jgi:uncharacterized Tic20 family protein
VPTSDRVDPIAPERDPPGKGTAVMAQSLYLANLLLLPGLAFAVLAWLYLGRERDTPALARAHLDQTFRASLWAGALLVAVSLIIVALGGFQGAAVWTVLILYFTICHSSLVLVGIVGLAKAMAGQCFRFPLIGRPLPEDCAKWQRGGGLL